MQLIINADDTGYTKAGNKAAAKLYAQGILTSTTVMMNMPASEDAMQMLEDNQMPAGVHINLATGSPLTGKSGLTREDGNFSPLDILEKQADPKLVKAEIDAQIRRFQAYGLTPTHLDYHKFLHEHPALFGLFIEVAAAYALPVRTMSTQTRQLALQNGLKTIDKLFFDVYGASDKYAQLKAIAHNSGNFTGEVVVHVSTDGTELLGLSSYNTDRREEYEALLKAAQNRIFNNIPLVSYSQI